MLRDRSVLIFGALVVVALGLPLIMMPRAGNATSAPTQGEFPADWFAPSTDEEQVAQAKLVGNPMPALELSNWHNGQRSLDDLKGKVVVIDFWATWCAPCIAAFPENSELFAKYQAKGVEMFGICTNTGQGNYEKILADKKPTYPVAQDEKLNTMNAWTAKTYPTYAVVDRKGIVRAISLKHEYLVNVIDKLLAEPAP